MDSQPPSGVRFVAARRLQRLLDEMTFPTRDRIMEGHRIGCLSVEDAWPCTLLSLTLLG